MENNIIYIILGSLLGVFLLNRSGKSSTPNNDYKKGKLDAKLEDAIKKREDLKKNKPSNDNNEDPEDFWNKK